MSEITEAADRLEAAGYGSALDLRDSDLATVIAAARESERNAQAFTNLHRSTGKRDAELIDLRAERDALAARGDALSRVDENSIILWSLKAHELAAVIEKAGAVDVRPGFLYDAIHEISQILSTADTASILREHDAKALRDLAERTLWGPYKALLRVEADHIEAGS